MVAEIFERAPNLGIALDVARGPCLRFQRSHPSGRRCKKGDSCPFLHVPRGQDLALARNRLRAPFLQLTQDNRLLLVPPLRQAVAYWWRHTLGQDDDTDDTDDAHLDRGTQLENESMEARQEFEDQMNARKGFEPSASAASSSGAAASAASAAPAEAAQWRPPRRQAVVETSKWAPPRQAVIESTTALYTRRGRQHLPLPEQRHIVLVYHNKRHNSYAAYCRRCDVWMDWPPVATNSPRKPRLGSPCTCVEV